MSRPRAHATANGQDASQHAARYEALRVHATHGHVPAIRDGLVIVLRQGVAAWMQACSELPAPPLDDERPRPTHLPPHTSAEVVHVLAAMLLGRLQEAHA